MTRLPFLLLTAGLLSACASTTPNWDKRFGESVRDARQAMTINPEAGRKPDPVTGIDGRAAQAAQDRYEQSFKQPPPAVNVINIGGSIGGGGGSGGAR